MAAICVEDGREDLPHLPAEIVTIIAAHVADQQESQATLAAMCLVCRMWHDAAAVHLYKAPKLSLTNAYPFLRTMSKQQFGHDDGPIRELCILDMSALRSLDTKIELENFTPTVLAATKATVEKFIAPYQELLYFPMAALSDCHQLVVIDLTRIYRGIPIGRLHPHISRLPRLRELRLPGCISTEQLLTSDVPLFPCLDELHFTQLVDWVDLGQMQQMAHRVRAVRLQNTQIQRYNVLNLVNSFGKRLCSLDLGTNLTAGHNMGHHGRYFANTLSRPHLEHMRLTGLSYLFFFYSMLRSGSFDSAIFDLRALVLDVSYIEASTFHLNSGFDDWTACLTEILHAITHGPLRNLRHLRFIYGQRYEGNLQGPNQLIVYLDTFMKQQEDACLAEDSYVPCPWPAGAWMLEASQPHDLPLRWPFSRD